MKDLKKKATFFAIILLLTTIVLGANYYMDNFGNGTYTNTTNSTGNLTLDYEGLDYPDSASFVFFFNDDLVDDTGNYTLTNASAVNYATGKHDQGYDVEWDGSTTKRLLTGTSISLAENESESGCVWLKQDTTLTTYTSVNVVGLITQYDGFWRAFRLQSGKVNFYTGDSLYYDYTDADILNWNFICYTYNGSIDTHNKSIYWNGEYKVSSSDNAPAVSGKKVIAGESAWLYQNINGTIDDVMWFKNYTLNPTEIQELYDGTKDKYYSSGSYESDWIDTNLTNYNITELNFSGVADSGTYQFSVGNSSDCSNVYNWSDSFNISGTEPNITDTECFKWRVTFTSNGTYSPEIEWINISYESLESDAPNITLTSPADGFRTYWQNISIIANIIDASAVSNVSLYVNGTLNETNSSGVNGDYTFSKNFVYGSYSWYIRACDSGGYCNNSETRTLTTYRPTPEGPAGTPGEDDEVVNETTEKEKEGISLEQNVFEKVWKDAKELWTKTKIKYYDNLSERNRKIIFICLLLLGILIILSIIYKIYLWSQK